MARDQHALTEAQAACFAKEGWLVEDDVLRPAEVEALRGVLEQPPFVESSFASDRAVHFLNITTLHPAFLALAKDSRIMARIVPLLGPNIQLHHSKTATKPPTPGTGEFKYHQDFAYYPHTNADVLARQAWTNSVLHTSHKVAPSHCRARFARSGRDGDAR
jgi:phytanoyl-CoA hydroxylase